MARSIRYWDSCCFLGWLAEEEDKVDACKEVLDVAEAGRLTIVTSTLTLAEVVKLKGDHAPLPPENEERIDQFFKRDFIVLRQVDRRVGELARRLYWQSGIDPKDAIHVATALVHGLPDLDTTDHNPIKKSGVQIDDYGPLQIAWPKWGDVGPLFDGVTETDE
jgi:predicted nucleic acid-binding protein